jgi:hypothetical protein
MSGFLLLLAAQPVDVAVSCADQQQIVGNDGLAQDRLIYPLRLSQTVSLAYL